MLGNPNLSVSDEHTTLELIYAGNQSNGATMPGQFYILEVVDRAALARAFAVKLVISGDVVGSGTVHACVLRHSYVILYLDWIQIVPDHLIKALFNEFAKFSFENENIHRVEVRSLKPIDALLPNFAYEGSIHQKSSERIYFYSKYVGDNNGN